VRVRSGDAVGGVAVELVDESGAPVAVVSAFLGHLAARGCSPNTLAAYAYDLRHLWLFLAARGLDWQDFGPPHALELLEALRTTPSRRPAQRLGLTVATSTEGRPARRLAPATINRVLVAVSSFYEYAILAGVWDRASPIEKRPDPSLLLVPERHRPFMGRASRQRPVRRAVRVKTVQRVPRPVAEGQVRALLGELRCVRDRAIVLLMLQGGLRPGEVLGLQLDDIAYGRRRVVVRHREDHPKGVRQKSRYERVVDLHEPEALAAVSEYAMRAPPRRSASWRT
jgi:integrase